MYGACVGYKAGWNSLCAKSYDFSSLVRFTRFVKSTDLSRFLLLGY